MQILFGVVVVVVVAGLAICMFAESLPGVLTGRERGSVVWIATIGILFKLVTVAVWYSFAGSALSDWWVDTYSYDSSGLLVAEHFLSGDFSVSAINQTIGNPLNPGYSFLVGTIYAVFGHHQWMVSILNSLATVVLAMMMYHIAIRLFTPKVAKWTLVLTLSLPFFMHTSFYLVKDNVVALLVVATVWGVVVFNEKRVTFTGVLLPAVSILCLLPFRPQYAIILGLLVPLHFAFSASSHKGRFAVALVVLAVFVGLVSYVKPQGYSGLSVLQTQTFDPTAYHTDVPELMSGVSPGDLGDVLGRIVGHPIAFVQYGMQGLFLLLWGSPQLYSRTSPSICPAWWSIDAIFRIVVMPVVLYGVYHCLRYQRSRTLLLYAFPLALTATLILFAGADLRYGLPMMPFMMMFGAIGCSHFDRIRPLYILYLMLFAVFAAINTSLNSGTTGMFLLCILVSIMLLLAAFATSTYRKIRLGQERSR